MYKAQCAQYSVLGEIYSVCCSVQCTLYITILLFKVSKLCIPYIVNYTLIRINLYLGF